MGVIEWQRTLGGNISEMLYSVKQTSDGGYIAGGLATSFISGDKTEYTQGGVDVWVIKLDETDRSNGRIPLEEVIMIGYAQ